MSEPRLGDDHLGLDALAECLAAPARPSTGVGRHLAGCSGCAARLAELRDAEPAVAAALSSLPSLSLPDDVATRLNAALRELGADVDAADVPPSATVTTLAAPEVATGRSPLRWLTAAAAAVVLLVAGGLGIAQLTRSDPPASTTTSSAATGSGQRLIRNNTGTDYANRAALIAAVPSLLAGTASTAGAALSAPAPARAAPDAKAQSGTTGSAAGGVASAPDAPRNQKAADPLARLRTDAGLADCLLALLPPDQPEVQPLALDYASYAGRPAMVVLLPGAASGKVDVFVVGPGCSRANDSTLFYTSVASP